MSIVSKLSWAVLFELVRLTPETNTGHLLNYETLISLLAVATLLCFFIWNSFALALLDICLPVAPLGKVENVPRAIFFFNPLAFVITLPSPACSMGDLIFSFQHLLRAANRVLHLLCSFNFSIPISKDRKGPGPLYCAIRRGLIVFSLKLPSHHISSLFG